MSVRGMPRINPVNIRGCNLSPEQMQCMREENHRIWGAIELSFENSQFHQFPPQIAPLTFRTFNCSLLGIVAICEVNTQLYMQMGLGNVYIRVVDTWESTGEKVKVFVTERGVFEISSKQPNPLRGEFKIERMVTRYFRDHAGELRQDPRPYLAFKSIKPCILNPQEIPPLEREARVLAYYADVPEVVDIVAYSRFVTKKEGLEKESLTELIVMPRLRENLLTVVKEKRLTINQISNLTLKLWQGVEKIHLRGDVHRDLKLENILVDESINPFIADFGMCRLFTDHGQLDAGGSPLYIAPECAKLCCESKKGYAWQQHLQQITQPANDVWALGLILCVMLQKENPSRLPVQLDERLFPKTEDTAVCLRARASLEPNFFTEPSDSGSIEHLLWRMLQIDPSRRISISHALNALRRIFPSIAETSDRMVGGGVLQSRGGRGVTPLSGRGQFHDSYYAGAPLYDLSTPSRVSAYA